MKSYRVEFLPFDLDVEAPAGATVLEAAKLAGLPLKAGCGGEGTCGDCVVRVVEGDYQKKASAALSESLVEQGYVLACRTEIQDDLTVLLPEFQELSIRRGAEARLLDEREISGFCEVEPPVRVLELEVPAPTLEDNFSDLKRLEREIMKQSGWTEVGCTYSALQQLPEAIRVDGGRVRVVIYKSGACMQTHPLTEDAVHVEDEAEAEGETRIVLQRQSRPVILDVLPQSSEFRLCGLACDIGTSTVAMHLVDMATGEILASASSLNQQVKCGEDIISRIHYARKPGRLIELHLLIVGTINHLIAEVTDAASVPESDIYYASFAGNTTMLHLFLNLEPRYIREEPYVPVVNQAPEVSAQDVGLDINLEGRVFFAPAVGSYVGGDITAGLLCTPMLREREGVSMFIDAGTNGELVVGNRDWLVTCACSAGPAFEGSGIKCGMPAAEGAIEKLAIREDGSCDYVTIGEGPPKGLCGSGLVDLLAELFVHGYIDRQGKFDPDKSRDMMVEEEGGRGFLVERASACFWGKDLVITETGIANLIRTKGAVFSACALLLKNVGLSWDEIEAFYVAGGFGRSLDIENSVRIGLLPDLDRGRFHYLGNSSLQGAYLVLLSDRNKRLVEDLARNMTYIELNTEPGYMNEYTGSLFLPHTDMRLFPSVERVRGRRQNA